MTCSPRPNEKDEMTLLNAVWMHSGLEVRCNCVGGGCVDVVVVGCCWLLL